VEFGWRILPGGRRLSLLLRSGRAVLTPLAAELGLLGRRSLRLGLTPELGWLGRRSLRLRLTSELGLLGRRSLRLGRGLRNGLATEFGLP
jgi:hypothetical protein